MTINQRALDERELASHLLELAEESKRVADELPGLSDEQISDRLEDVEAAMIRVTNWRPGATPRSNRITRGRNRITRRRNRITQGRVDHGVDATLKGMEQAD